jgi:hypothetical protein
MKKFGIVCKTKENFEKIKSKYRVAWKDKEYEFVWIKPEDLGIAGKEIDIVFHEIN